MKKLLLLIALTPSVLFSQDSVSLRRFCPTKIGQEGGLCFAYAPVYTALSIETNIKNNESDENSNSFEVFSYGFVASKVKKDKSVFGRIFNKCGRNGTVDLALGILLNTGTVLFSDFPEKCDCGKVNYFIQGAEKYKIRDTAIIGDANMEAETHIEHIKKALKKNKPVIITVFQEKFFYNSKGKFSVDFPTSYERNSKNANHVICIIGFNNAVNGGSFLVKNNYTWWGNDGFAYVKYADLIKIIRYSYIFNI
jgi:C1A family cysteine protease